jgi:hypothetical protein
LKGENYAVIAIKHAGRHTGAVSADPYQQKYVYYRVQNNDWNFMVFLLP